MIFDIWVGILAIWIVVSLLWVVGTVFVGLLFGLGSLQSGVYRAGDYLKRKWNRRHWHRLSRIH